MHEIKTQIEKIKADVKQLLVSCHDSDGVEQLRVQFLGKKGAVTSLYKNLKSVSPEQRPAVGDLINSLKDEILGELDKKKIAFQGEKLQQRLASEELDVTLPGKPTTLGRIHPITKVLQRVIDIFQSLGFFCS